MSLHKIDNIALVGINEGVINSISNKISNTSNSNDCKNQCDNEPNCILWSFIKQNNQCSLYNSNDNNKCKFIPCSNSDECSIGIKLSK